MLLCTLFRTLMKDVLPLGEDAARKEEDVRLRTQGSHPGQKWRELPGGLHLSSDPDRSAPSPGLSSPPHLPPTRRRHQRAGEGRGSMGCDSLAWQASRDSQWCLLPQTKIMGLLSQRGIAAVFKPGVEGLLLRKMPINQPRCI